MRNVEGMDYREEYRIADLISRQFMGVITPEEKAELDEWCRQEGPGMVCPDFK